MKSEKQKTLEFEIECKSNETNHAVAEALNQLTTAMQRVIEIQGLIEKLRRDYN